MDQETGGLHHLSKRERDVAALLMQGMSNKQIAMALSVTIRTVEFHLGNIYSKLGIASRTEAVLKLADAQLRESTGLLGSDRLGESTVERKGKAAKNEGHLILRRIPVKKSTYIIVFGGLLLVTVLALILIIPKAPDYHSDEEISQAALASAYDNFNSIEMKIESDDQHQIGEVVLNQFLKKFRQRETHYGIRLASYEIVDIDFIDEVNSQLSYTADVKVVPRDKTRFVKIIDGVAPYQEDDNGEFLFSFVFAVLQQDDTYKLVDIELDAE